MNEREKKVKKYYCHVRRLLPCSRKVKTAIMRQIQENIEGYISENPCSDFDQIKTQFGAPESIAAAYIESTGTAEILKSMSIRRRIIGIIGIVLVAALLTWTCYLAWTAVKVNNVLKSMDGSYDDSYIVEGTVEIEPQETDCVSHAP